MLRSLEGEGKRVEEGGREREDNKKAIRHRIWEKTKINEERKKTKMKIKYVIQYYYYIMINLMVKCIVIIIIQQTSKLTTTATTIRTTKQHAKYS